MRIAIFIILAALTTGCAHTAIDESRFKDEYSDCDRNLEGDWRRLDAPPVNSKVFLPLLKLAKEPRNTIWYKSSNNSFAVCFPMPAPGCESDNINGIADRSTSGGIYEFKNENGSWTSKSLAEEVGRVCVRGD